MNELQVFTNPEFGQVRTVTIEVRGQGCGGCLGV